MDSRSVVSLEDDERSNCTSATTASLASRMQSLAVDFGPKHRQRRYDQFTEDEEEDIVSVSEEELLKELDRQEPAFQVTTRGSPAFLSLKWAPKHLVKGLEGCLARVQSQTTSLLKIFSQKVMERNVEECLPLRSCSL